MYSWGHSAVMSIKKYRPLTHLCFVILMCKTPNSQNFSTVRVYTCPFVYDAEGILFNGFLLIIKFTKQLLLYNENIKISIN